MYFVDFLTVNYRLLSVYARLFSTRCMALGSLLRDGLYLTGLQVYTTVRLPAGLDTSEYWSPNIRNGVPNESTDIEGERVEGGHVDVDRGGGVLSFLRRCNINNLEWTNSRYGDTMVVVAGVWCLGRRVGGLQTGEKGKQSLVAVDARSMDG